MLRAAEEEREKKEAAARAKRREEDRKRQEAEAKQRRETEARVIPLGLYLLPCYSRKGSVSIVHDCSAQLSTTCRPPSSAQE